VCIYGAVVYVMISLKSNGSEALFTLTAGLCLLANQLYSTTPLARPDGLGFFLYVLAALIPWNRNFSPGSLAFSAILATLAFFTKVYFYLAVLYIGVYLFLCVSKRTAVFFAIFCASLLLAAAFAVRLGYPYYFYNTLFMVAHGDKYIFSHVLTQFKRFGKLYLGMLAGVFLFLGWQMLSGLRFPGIRGRQVAAAFSLWDLDRPFYLGKLDYPLLACLLATAVVAGWLGGHLGSKMVYLFQLIGPFFVIVIARWFTRRSQGDMVFRLLAGITLAANLAQILLDTRRNGTGWR
jgi:hypothetical protein